MKICKKLVKKIFWKEMFITFGKNKTLCGEDEQFSREIFSYLFPPSLSNQKMKI